MSASILSPPRPPQRGTFHCLSSSKKEEIVCLLCLCSKTAPARKNPSKELSIKTAERKKEIGT